MPMFREWAARVQPLRVSRTPLDVFDQIATLTRLLGFTHATLWTRPAHSANADVLILQNVSPAWDDAVREYARRYGPPPLARRCTVLRLPPKVRWHHWPREAAALAALDAAGITQALTVTVANAEHGGITSVGIGRAGARPTKAERASVEPRLLLMAHAADTALAPLHAGPLDVPLTKRELEVVTLAARGMTTNAIAEHMGIKPTTIEEHRVHIMRKLGAANFLAAVALSVERGFIRLG